MAPHYSTVAAQHPLYSTTSSSNKHSKTVPIADDGHESAAKSSELDSEIQQTVAVQHKCGNDVFTSSVACSLSQVKTAA